MATHKTIQGSIVGLSFLKETSLGVAPSTMKWKEVEPNSYANFGATIATVQRSPIVHDRQRRKGGVSDIDANVGFNIDMLTTNLNPFLEGFLFCHVTEKATTQPEHTTTALPAITLTSVASASKQYKAASGLGRFKVGDIVKGEGFTQRANNVVTYVTGVSGTAVTVNASVADEASPSNGKLLVVGRRFDSGDLTMTMNGDIPTLGTTSADFTTMGLTVGEYVFIGGDTAGSQFANAANIGFARIKSIAANSLVLDKTERPFQTDNGSGKNIELYFGTDMRNAENYSDIHQTSYQFERTLGADADGTMYQYVEGCIPNQITLNIPATEKVNADLTFYGTNTLENDGATGRKGGTSVSAPVEDLYNTSSDCRKFRMTVLDENTATPSSLFGFISQGTVVINNNLTANKAVSVLGALDVTAGMFDVSATTTAYFTDITAISAVKKNTSVTLDMSFARNNSGFVMDIPLMTVSEAELDISTEEPITVPLNNSAAKGKAGNSISYNFFAYLPTVSHP